MAYPKNSFHYQNKIASQAALEITQFLVNRNKVIDVFNTEENKRFQKYGSDLLCSKHDKDKIVTNSIEIKGDTHSYSPNYFIEVIGNDVKGTPGGMIYTKADYVFYYFINIKELHVIDRVSLQEWIKNNGQALEYRDVRTVDNNNNFLYNTVGALVSRELLKRTIPIWIYDLNSRKLTFKPDPKILGSGLFELYMMVNCCIS